MRGYLPLALVAEPEQMRIYAAHETQRAPARWRHRPVPGTLRTRWLYAHCASRAPKPLDEPTRTVEFDGDDGMPPWATHLMLLITAEVDT